MSVSKILNSIVNGLVKREVKADSAVNQPKVISYSGLYYSGSQVKYVIGNKSSEFVEKYIPYLSDIYSPVSAIYPSAKDEPWDPDMSDLALAGTSTMNYGNPEQV